MAQAWRLTGRVLRARAAGWALALALASVLASGPSAQAQTQTQTETPPEVRPASSASSARACGRWAPSLVALAPGVWLVPGASGEADVGNRGRVSHGLLVADGPRLWLLGSGPSPAAGRALACVVARQLPQRRVSDVVSPWARPELVLGVRGLGPVRHWAHAEVADAMAQRCPHCVARLAARLGLAAVDLGRRPVHLPEHRLVGEAGQLGPLQWWRLQRAPGHVVTVWRLALPGTGLATAPGAGLQAGAPGLAPGEVRAEVQAEGSAAVQPGGRAGVALWFSPGVLNGDGPGDARDASVAGLLSASSAVAALAAADGAAARHLGEQGPLQGAGLPQAHEAYWRDLLAQVAQVQATGGSEAAPAQRWPGLPEAWARHPWHALNWQRAWRELEADALAAPPEPQRGAFQRSLR